MTDTKRNYKNANEQISALQEKIEKLEIKARTSIFPSTRIKARAEIEKTKRLIHQLREIENGKIQHAVLNYDKCYREANDYESD